MASNRIIPIEIGLHPIDKKGEKQNKRVNRIFVVEEILAEQARKTDQPKYGQELFNLSSKSLSQLMLWNIGYLLAILLACVLWSIPISIIPIINSIIFPSYWWTMIVNGNLVANSLYVTGKTVMEIKIIFNLPLSDLWRPLAWTFALHFLSTIIPLSASYLVWTTWLGLNFPMPFLGLMLYISWYSTHYAAIWVYVSSTNEKKWSWKKKNNRIHIV